VPKDRFARPLSRIAARQRECGASKIPNDLEKHRLTVTTGLGPLTWINLRAAAYVPAKAYIRCVPSRG
jgi:hypothetical protein